MATLIINSMVFDFPPLDLVGQSADDFTRAYLNNLRFIRLRARMTHWLTQQVTEPSPAEFQAELLRQVKAFEFRDVVKDDLVENEALELATEELRKRLASLDLPLPRSPKEHAEQLVAADPRFRLEAKRRVEARASAALEIASGLLTAEAGAAK